MPAAVHSAPRTERTRARACGLRTNAMCSIPSSRMSSTNWECPDRIRSSSRRRTGRPIDPAAPTTTETTCGKLRLAVKLRLYHHPDGARIAYREAGTGPPLALLHSAGLTHREWEPIVDELAHRYRVVLPDLPLHGASEDRPTHPYSPDWLIEVLAGFLLDTCGPRPLVAGHGIGAQLMLLATAAPAITPAKLVVLPSPMHTKPHRSAVERTGRVLVRAAVVPGVDRVL